MYLFVIACLSMLKYANIIWVMKYQVPFGKHPRVHWDQRHLHPVRDVQPAGWHRRRWQACFAYSVGAIGRLSSDPGANADGVPSSLHSIIWHETRNGHCSLKWLWRDCKCSLSHWPVAWLMVPVSKLWQSQVCCSTAGVWQKIPKSRILASCVFSALKKPELMTDDVENPFKF